MGGTGCLDHEGHPDWMGTKGRKERGEKQDCLALNQAVSHTLDGVKITAPIPVSWSMLVEWLENIAIILVEVQIIFAFQKNQNISVAHMVVPMLIFMVQNINMDQYCH
jgi:hypothetical protein